MGAWNYGIFDDDTAYDALYDLRASQDLAAVIDSVINGTPYRCGRSERVSVCISFLKRRL